MGGISGDRCFQGTFSLDTRVNGEGFDYVDGTAVRAYFAMFSGVAKSATEIIEAGAFGISFSFPNDTCNLGASLPGGGALYIDVDGDGECSVTEDDIFVWTAGSPGSLDSIAPDSSRCLRLNPEVDEYALAAAQHLCPSVGDCLAFCGPEPPLASYGDFDAFCPAPDAGAPDAGKVDAGQSDAGPSDAGE